MDQQIRMLAIKLDKLTLIPATHMVKREQTAASCPLIYTNPLMYIQMSVIFRNITGIKRVNDKWY